MKKSFLTILIGLFATSFISAQNLEGKNVQEQFEYIQEKSSRWQTFTMIPDPYFNLLRTSAIDTLKAREAQITDLKQIIHDKNEELDNINKTLNETRIDLENTEKEKNSFSVFGMNLSKGFFLNLVTFIFIGLIVIAVVTILYAKKERFSAIRAKKDLEQLKMEFEDYRQNSRKEKEKLVVQHHKEIQKLKGS